MASILNFDNFYTKIQEGSKDPYDKAKVMKVKGKFEVYTTQDGEIKTFDTEAEAKKFADDYNKKNIKEIMPGVDLGASFEKMKGRMNTKDEFKVFDPKEKDRLREVGLDSAKKFHDSFSVLDFFGGSLPNSYESARMEAAQAGYDLSTEMYDEAAMMAQDAETDEADPEDYGPETDAYISKDEIDRRARMMEATEAEVAQRKSAIEEEDAKIAKDEAALATRAEKIKDDDPNAMTERQILANERAVLAQRKADLEKKRAEVAATA